MRDRFSKKDTNYMAKAKLRLDFNQAQIFFSILGSDNGLRLLLNIERYERVESCTPYFRTMSLPGLKILIYNQTDVPESSLAGVNVPPGYTMEIPFKMQNASFFIIIIKYLFKQKFMMEILLKKKSK